MWWQKRLNWLRVGESIVYADQGCLRTHELKSDQDKELYCQPDVEQFMTLSVSPDGRNLVFGTMDGTGTDASIWIMPVGGGKPSKLVSMTGSSAAKRTIGGISWTPDGKHLIYAKSENAGYGLYQISATGGAPQKLYYSGDPGFASLSMHPGGRQIALSASVVEDEVWVIENTR